MIFLKIGIVLILLLFFTLFSKIYLEKNKKKTILTFNKSSIKGFNFPIVTFYHNKKPVNFLVDSGSDKCIIDENVLNIFKYKKLSIKGTVSGVNNENIEVYYVRITLHDKDCKKCFTDAFQVIPIPTFPEIEKEFNLKISGILGGTFLKKYATIIDYTTSSITLKNNDLCSIKPSISI